MPRILPRFGMLAVGVVVLALSIEFAPVMPIIAGVILVVAGGVWLATNRRGRRSHGDVER